jgi:hypothetical protein
MTQVPQPAITPAGQNSGAQGVTPGSGDYTTNATDAQVSAVGPALAIQRYYDSGDTSTTGAFGAGWSSILDMRVTGIVSSPGNQVGPDTAVVTYPEGEQVAFGENLDGSYSPPQGRYASLAYASGSYTLTDKNDTTYTFSEQVSPGVYGLTSITDALGNAEQFTWNNKLSPPEINEVSSVASQRYLSIEWSTPAGAGAQHVSTVTPGSVASGPAGNGLLRRGAEHRAALVLAAGRFIGHVGVQHGAGQRGHRRRDLSRRHAGPGRAGGRVCCHVRVVQRDLVLRAAAE